MPTRLLNRILNRYILLYVFLLLSARVACGTEYVCHQLSLDQGLSHSNVTAIARDGRGFMWFGTRFGLNRYDFENTTNYYHDPDDPSSIPGNAIVALHTDARGCLWVATEHGIACHDDATDSFKPVIFEGKILEGRCFIDETNGLLIGGAGTLYFYDFSSGSLAQLQAKGGSSYAYRSIHRRSPDSYILSTRWDGIWLFDRTDASVTRYPGVPDKNIMATTIDSNGVLYYSPYGEGFRACDRAGTHLFTYTSANSPLNNDIVLDICEHDGKIWIATDGGGITIYDPATGEFDSRYNSETLSLLGSVTTLYVDSHDNVYAGTVRDGALTILPTAMRTIQPRNGAHFSALTAMCRDRSGRTWVGDDGHGVMVYDPASDAFETIPSTANLKVTDICEHDANRLLVATFANGFYLLDKNTGRLSEGPAALKRLWDRQPNHAIPIHLRMLAPNAIAIITDIIDTYNPIDGTVPVRYSRNKRTGSLIPFFNHSGRLLCHAEETVVDFDPVTGQTAEILRVPLDEHIHCAAFDGHNTLYLALNKGVMRYNTYTGVTDTVAALPVRVSAMVCEPDGHLWIATTRAIYLHTPGQSALASFGVNDGVLPNEYLPNATLATDGRVFFGGVYGLLRILTDELDAIVAPRPDPILNLADVKIDGVSFYGLIRDGELTVPDRFNKLTLSVIDNGPDSQRRSRFRFIARSKDTERVTESEGRTVDLSLLKPGESYDVELCCRRPDGTWTHPQHLVRLAVMDPWFKSTLMWGIALIIIIALGAIWELRQRRVRRQRMDQQLETYRHSILEREVSFFVNTNYALRTPLTLIYAPLKLALERLRRGEKDDLLPELERVYKNTKKMRDTIDMALELHQRHTKPEAGSLTTHDINRSVHDVIKSLSADAATKQITVSYLPSQEIFPAVYDRERIGVVIGIFLHNALSRSADHSTIEVRATLNGEMIRVAITDFGPTPDIDTLTQMFSWYFSTNEESGYYRGISFAYTKNIIELHDGTVGAEANPDNNGLTVWFEIPVAAEHDAEAYARRRHEEALEPPAEIEPVVSNVDTSAMTALVVDGDNDLCLFIAGQLSEYFRKVYHAFNGKDALLMIKQYQPDIVISSLHLPGMSGLELCQAVKSSPDTSPIPVILLTALKEGSTLENAYEAGADSYLSKPFDLNILLTRCRNLLHTRSVIRQRYADMGPKPDAVPRPVTHADETFLIKINKIISDNLSNPNFGVPNLVKMMATSRSALYSKFKEITGQTLGAYIADMRLKRACQLLTETDMSVNEISDMLGFNSQRYFSTFFKERTGQTPSAYRSNPRKVNDSTSIS